MESEKQYAMFIHLSQLAGSIVVGLGWILPLVLWLTKKIAPNTSMPMEKS